MHPSDEIRGVKSNILSNKKIILGVTGSIASIESIKLSRELIRHGAEVFPVMTSSSKKIIHPDSIEFATGNKPIIDLTGKIEHVFFCGKVKDSADLLLISPCTANTISKISYGIDDTAVTTFATTAIGTGIPILIVPAMHISMYDHKIIQNNIERCKKIGIKFIDPYLIGNKAKMANIDDIVAYSIREIGQRDMSNKKILVIGGSTAEAIDDVRVITNISSGKTVLSIVENAFLRGADVDLWYGHSLEIMPNYIKTLRFESNKDLVNLLELNNISKYDVIILCAAISDYIPKKKKGKISSRKKKLILELLPAPKIIKKLREKAPKSLIIGYKLEGKIGNLKDKSYELLKNNKLDFVVGNTFYGIGNNKNKILLIDKDCNIHINHGDKKVLANFVLDMINKS